MAMISVIMPAYKTAPFIREAVESVQKQTFADWELIVVDDGSPDDLAIIVREMMANDDRIRLVSQKNQGVAVARNKGLSLIKGEYVCFLDSDDYWYLTFLEKNYKNIIEKGADFSYSGFLKERKNRTIKKMGGHFYEVNVILNQLKGRQAMILPSVLFRRSLVVDYEISFIPGCAYGEDVEFMLKLLMRAKKVAAVADYLWVYRYREDSAVRSGWNLKREDALISLERTYKYFKKYYSAEDRERVFAVFERNITLVLYRTLMEALRSERVDAMRYLLKKYPQYSKNDKVLPWGKRSRLLLIVLNKPWSIRLLQLYSRLMGK